jgi:TP901 family phage tail tape measure protein
MSDNLKLALKIIADTSQAVSAIAKMDSGIIGLGKNLASAFGSQSFSALKRYTFEAANLNRELVRISQTAGSGLSSVSRMQKEIFAAAKATGVDYKNITEGYGKLAAGGLGEEQIKSIMKQVSKAQVLSTANSEQLTSALMVAGQAFGLDLTKDSETIMNKMYQAGKSGKAELEDLSLIISRVGPVAKSAGLGLEDMLAFVEGMAESGEGAEIVSTMGRAVLGIFNDSAVRQRIEKMTGAQFFDAQGNRNNALDIFDTIQKSYLGKSEGLERTKFFEQMTKGMDDRASKGLLSIIGNDSSVEKMRQNFKEISNSGNVIGKDLKDAMNNMVDQTNRLKANWAEITTSTVYSRCIASISSAAVYKSEKIPWSFPERALNALI